MCIWKHTQQYIFLYSNVLLLDFYCILIQYSGLQILQVPAVTCLIQHKETLAEAVMLRSAEHIHSIVITKTGMK